MATKQYIVTVEQLNRINPETREAEPLRRGDPIELDPTSPDALRWLEGNCILLVPGQDEAATDEAATDAEPVTPVTSATDDASGQHSARTGKAGKAPAGSVPSPAPSEDSGQGAPVS